MKSLPFLYFPNRYISMSFALNPFQLPVKFMLDIACFSHLQPLFCHGIYFLIYQQIHHYQCKFGIHNSYRLNHSCNIHIVCIYLNFSLSHLHIFILRELEISVKVVKLNPAIVRIFDNDSPKTAFHKLL